MFSRSSDVPVGLTSAPIRTSLNDWLVSKPAALPAPPWAVVRVAANRKTPPAMLDENVADGGPSIVVMNDGGGGEAKSYVQFAFTA